MSVCSPVFLLCLAALAIFYQLCSAAWSRRCWLTAANLAFLSTFMPDWRAWVGLAVFLAGGCGMLRWVDLRPRRAALSACLVLIVTLYMMVKLNIFLDAWQFVGVSYMLFKFIHALVDVAQRQLSPEGALCYANYQLSFFTLVAGPIQRYGDFQAFWRAMDGGPPDPRYALQAWNRVLIGMLKNGAIGPLCWQACLAAWSLADPEWADGVRFVSRFYAYPIWLYFNFSGYVDVMIGAAQLLGCRLPENFNYPFLARNIIDFWNRWHITLTHWIRDYVFMTSYKAVAERWPSISKPAGYALIFLSLLLAGVWHGATLGFAVFGSLHGIAAAANEIYGVALKRWLGREGAKRYQQSLWVRGLAIVATFHFVCFSMLFFALDYRFAVTSLRSFYGWLVERAPAVGAAGAVALYCAAWFGLASLAAGVGTYGAAGLELGRQALERGATCLRRNARAQYALLVGQMCLVVLTFIVIWVLEQKDPIVVYQAF